MRLAKPHKYRAKPCVIDGTHFPSQAEGRRYQELRLMEKAGEIADLVLQPAYPITINGALIGSYFADFRYRDNRNRQIIVEDVKGFANPLFLWKKKCVEAQYGIQINIVKMKGASHGRRRSTKR